MRITSGLAAAALAMSIAAPSATLASGAIVPASVVAVRVVTDGGDVRGTAVLIRQDERGDETTLSFLTSARLFHPSGEDVQRPPMAVELRLEDGRTLNITHDDVIVGGGAFVDVAILRVTIARAGLRVQPAPVVFHAPDPGAVFLISGLDEHGGDTSVAEHVRFRSTLLVLGDRDASGLADCVGAPAFAADGIFGVVRECEPNRVPVISLLSMAQPFFERHLPRLTTSVAPTAQFRLVEREVTAPLTITSCGVPIGEVSVPVPGGPRELLTDATAQLIGPRERPLGDLTVLRLDDRAVHLLFTVGATSAPPAPPSDCPQGQALMALHLRLAATRTP
jgi:hypothetical protein